MYYLRTIQNSLEECLSNFPVTALIGPRQCGKSTLAKHIMRNYSRETLYLDLERPSDLDKLRDAEWFLNSQKDKLICIDEVQRKPELFPLIRSLVDEWNRPGCFLVLGSASRDLLMQSSESLAGRIIYKQLTPFLWSEVDDINNETYMIRGGFPRSLLASSNNISREWLGSFISTFLERDLLQWLNFTPQTMRRLWQMLAHNNGQTVNFSAFGNSLGVSNQTVKNYINLLQSTYMVDAIQPYYSNQGKRLVKAPKVYVSDSGIVAALLGIVSFEALMGHPAIDSIWEGLVLLNIRGHFPEASIYYYRTSGGSEIDFVVEWNNKIIALECKASYVPSLSKGSYMAIEDVKPTKFFVVTPNSESWEMSKNIEVISLKDLEAKIMAT